MSTLPVFRSYRGASVAAVFAAGRFCCFGGAGDGAAMVCTVAGGGFDTAAFRAGAAAGKAGSLIDGSRIDARPFMPPMIKL